MTALIMCSRDVRGYTTCAVNTERTIEILVLGYPGASGQRPTMSAHYVVLGEKHLDWDENATIATSSDAPIEQVDL
jgi:hypothetical protein